MWTSEAASLLGPSAPLRSWLTPRWPCRMFPATPCLALVSYCPALNPCFK
jgi:hypothetical protein